MPNIITFVYLNKCSFFIFGKAPSITDGPDIKL